ncbi:hypothetical protein RGUI_2850 [Rhodovulum sp. P5]|nr:hypothetical protein RGUI_2850 [Rhodovulum sp. P5]
MQRGAPGSGRNRKAVDHPRGDQAKHRECKKSDLRVAWPISGPCNGSLGHPGSPPGPIGRASPEMIRRQSKWNITRFGLCGRIERQARCRAATRTRMASS